MYQYPHVTETREPRREREAHDAIVHDVIAPRREPLHVTIAKFDAMRVALGVNAKQ